MPETYPLFRDYSKAIYDWLREVIFIPRIEQFPFDIEKIVGNGTTDGGTNQHEIHLFTDNHNIRPNAPIKLEGTKDGVNDDIFVVERVVDNILILDKDYKWLKGPQNEPSGTATNTVNIMYGNMSRAIAKIAQPLRNGTIQNPGVMFYLADYQPVVERFRPPENYYKRTLYDELCNKVGTKAVPPLLTYRLTYAINIWTYYAQERDILEYQIVSQFTPQKFFWIGDKEYDINYTDNLENNRYDREFHGQWAHSLIEARADLSDLEPGTAQERTLRSEITFAITNAYLPMPFDADQSIISEINLETNISNRLKRI